MNISLRQTSRLIVLGCASFLAACQATSAPKPLSVEEAKRVTTTFVGPRVSPPRTVDDISALLDQPGQELPGARRLTAVADSQPPERASQAQLAAFYLERGQSAHGLGRVPQDIDDLRLAMAYAREASVLTWALMRLVTYELGWAEYRHGNYRRAVELMTENTRSGDGWAVSAYCGLTRMHAWAGDLPSARASLREAAALASRRPGEPWGPVNVAGAQASIFGATGEYAEAERELRHSISLARSSGVLHTVWEERERLILVFFLLGQGRLVEAEVETRDVIAIAVTKTGKYSQLTGHAVARLAWVLHSQGRFTDAERVARIASELLDRAGDARASYYPRMVQNQLGAALAAQERWSEAVTQFEKVAEDDGAYRASLSRLRQVDFPLALLRVGRTAEAIPLLRAAVDRRTQSLGAQHYGTAEARGVLAMGLAAADDRVGALREFDTALPVLLARAYPSAQEGDTGSARLQRLGLIVEAYLELLTRLRGSTLERDLGFEVTDETFRAADVVRSRTVTRALGASAARAAAREPELADLVRRGQDTEQQLQALYGALGNTLSMRPDQQDPAVVNTLRSQLAQLTSARDILAREIERRFPGYAAMMAPHPVTLQEARSLLEPGEALIAFYVGHEQTFVWAVPKAGPAVFTAVPLGRATVGKAVGALRRSLAPGGPTLGDIPDFDVETAQFLYAKLLEPVATGWRDAQSLVIVPHGALAEIPMALLVTERVELGPERGALFSRYRAVPWLSRRVAVTHVPSVQALKSLRTQPPGRPDRRAFAGFGDPWFTQAHAKEGPRLSNPRELVVGGPLSDATSISLRTRPAPGLETLASADLARLPRLPDTAEEVRSIAASLGADLTRDVFLGARANEDTVKRTPLRDRRVLVFATHGLLPGDLDGLLQPALALSAPTVAGVGGDGLLTMEEILALELDADWVVLSACNTAAGFGAGAEAVSGLGQAFFYAGARSLLVSHWPVEVSSSKELTTSLFRLSATAPHLSRAEVLRRAMMTLLDGPGFVDARSGQTVFSYAHPLFWAPFALVGDGRGGDKAQP